MKRIERVMRGRVLVVDDSPMDRGLVTAMLQRMGIDSDVATDAKSGIRKALEGDYDAMIMDVHMPGMTGIDALQLVRYLERGDRRIPIIMATGQSSRVIRRYCVFFGCTAYVRKPLSMPTLRRLLRPYCEHVVTTGVARAAVASAC